MATVNGTPDVVVMVQTTGGWATVVGGATRDIITDARPLIVLKDPDDMPSNHYSRLVAFLRHGGWDFTADQIEAQTKPARIPEPTKSGVRVTANLIVHDNAVAELMRLNVDNELPWVVVNRFGAKRVQCGWQFSWDALLNQKVVAS